MQPLVASASDAASDTSLATVRAEAAKCATAADAVVLYRFFLSKEGLSEETRKDAEADLSDWIKREKRGEIRIGEDWLTGEEVARRRKETFEHIESGLALLKLNRVVMAEKELEAASKLNPIDGQAEMILGLVDCIFHRDDLKAMRHFQESARRDPTNHLAWNNAAVSGYWAKRTTKMAEDFENALARSDVEDAQAVANNMGRILAEGGVPTVHMGKLKDLYANALHEMGLKPFDAIKGESETDEDYEKRLATVCLFPRIWEESLPNKKRDGRKGMPADGQVFMGSGTGFVVAAGYVVTNHHVIDGAVQVSIMNPDKRGEFLPAEVIASNEEVDLAVLKCEALKAPPLPLQTKVPGRGTELMSLGYPETGVLGLGLKTTRGTIVTVPEPPDQMQFLHSAIVNRGNSGGPLVDETGAVLGVTVAFIKVENAMFVGIPVEEVWRFVRAHASDVKLLEAKERPKLDWPAVDNLVSPSTVFVQCKFNSRGIQ